MYTVKIALIKKRVANYKNVCDPGCTFLKLYFTAVLKTILFVFFYKKDFVIIIKCQVLDNILFILLQKSRYKTLRT